MSENGKLSGTYVIFQRSHASEGSQLYNSKLIQYDIVVTSTRPWLNRKLQCCIAEH